MQYPLISEYIESIRSAEDNFDKLSNLRPVLDDNGNPVMSSGNFAVVFKMKDFDTGKLYAVKCFTREQEERAERYREIIKVLEQEKSPYFVSTHYYDRELFVDTSQGDETEFPVLVMDWVEGVLLDLYLKSIRNSKFKRGLLSKQFQKLVCWLLPKHFAHGDIKPDNIIVKEDGSIVLVDYDGMFVPALRGKEALEMGTPLYRHATRTLSFFNEYIDDFAAVLLLLLLKVNELTYVEFDKYLTENTAEFLGFFDEFINYPSISPLLSAYIMVSTFGRIDRQMVSCLLSDNSDFDFNRESVLLDLARQGDAVAMKELGGLYKEGIYVPQSTSKAMQWYTLAKLLGNVDATCGLCYSIYHNTDFEEKNGIIHDQLRRSMVNFTYCREGERLYSDEKFESAFYWFKNAADMGASSAQRNLAICYDNGKGVDKDLYQAFCWYKKSAEAGNSKAQNNLAYYYYKGEGVAKDMAKAIYWWKQSAEGGDSSAQRNLGISYYNGYGVEKDVVKAIYWCKKAAEGGDAFAQNKLAECYYEGEGVEKDVEKAIYWWKKAAEGGDAFAQNKLVECYYEGEGVAKDMEKAIYWWKKSAERWNSEAQNKLAWRYYEGEGVAKDMEKAIYWWKKSAEAGNSTSQKNLGVCYAKGYGVEKDMQKAIYWWKKSAEAGDSSAQRKLAICYTIGDGVPKYVAKAIYWWEKAANNKDFSAMRILAKWYYNGIYVERSIEKSNYWLREMSIIKETKGLTVSQILKQYQFIETLTIEQFKKAHNNKDLKMESDDDEGVVLICGKEIVSLVDNTIPKKPMISRICLCCDGNASNNSIWVIHEEGLERGI